MQTQRSFLVTGASSGLGYAVASGLLEKGCATVVTARSTQTLEALKEKHPSLCTIIAGDLTQPNFIEHLAQQLPPSLSGAFINAGGPPAARLNELTLEQWNEAYRLLIRWKIQLTQLLLPLFIKKIWPNCVQRKHLSNASCRKPGTQFFTPYGHHRLHENPGAGKPGQWFNLQHAGTGFSRNKGRGASLQEKKRTAKYQSRCS